MTSLRDCLDGIDLKKDVLDKGFVELVDVMPRLVPHGRTCDYAVVQMARTSFGSGLKSEKEDEALLRYLMRHRHTSPFEGVVLKFHLKVPLFVANQIVRHRTASINQFSARYAEMKDEWYTPPNIRSPHPTNKQSSVPSSKDGKNEIVSAESDVLKNIDTACYVSHTVYKGLLTAGVAKELARTVLPCGMYTEMYFVMDLHNLLHFFSLRCAKDAQEETRLVAEAMLSLTEKIVPQSVKAWNEYRQKSITFTLNELKTLNIAIDASKGSELTPSERRELDTKLGCLPTKP